MRRLYLPLLTAFVLLTAACGRTDITLTAIPTRVPPRPTQAAALPTADVPSAPTEAAPAAPMPTAVTIGDVARGAALYTMTYNTAQGPWACSLCHNTGAVRLVGPGLGGVEARFATYNLNVPIENYLHDSIVHPNDFIVPADSGGAYPPNLMPQNYGELLSEQDVSDLVAYILSLP
jgi:cytochrome c553